MPHLHSKEHHGVANLVVDRYEDERRGGSYQRLKPPTKIHLFTTCCTVDCGQERDHPFG
jgi:hypothetical protein